MDYRINTLLQRGDKGLDTYPPELLQWVCCPFISPLHAGFEASSSAYGVPAPTCMVHSLNLTPVGDV